MIGNVLQDGNEPKQCRSENLQTQDLSFLRGMENLGPSAP